MVTNNLGGGRCLLQLLFSTFALIVNKSQNNKLISFKGLIGVNIKIYKRLFENWFAIDYIRANHSCLTLCEHGTHGQVDIFLNYQIPKPYWLVLG